jgi:hypothetical protein
MSPPKAAPLHKKFDFKHITPPGSRENISDIPKHKPFSRFLKMNDRERVELRLHLLESSTLE